MDINTLYPEEKHYQRWHRLTSFLLVCVFVLQATLPTVAIAAQLLNDQQIEAELSGTLQFQRAASHDNVLYRKIEYVEQPSSGMYGLKAFHDKLKDQYPHLLPAPQIIPLINSGLTVIIPFHSLGKPVGDNYVQSRLVRSQIFSLLGKQLINEETHGHNETTQIRRLYENALKFALLKKKKYGDVLDGSDHGFDMVWPEYRVIRGERVVVPVVYLTKATTDNNKVDAHVVQFTGNRVTWKDIEVNGQKLLLGRNTILESMNDLVNVGGEISSSGNLNLHVHGTLVNASGALKAVDNVSILANNVEHKTLVHRYSDQSSTGFYLTEYLDSPATILAQNGDIRLRTHGDIRVRGASFLAPNGSIKLQAYGDISVEAIALNSGREAQQGKNYYRRTSVGIVQSELSAQDAIKLMAQGKVTLNATKISSDQGAIEILAQQGVYIVDEQSQYQSHRKTKYSRVSQEIRQFQTVAIRSALEAGKDVVIASEYGDITLRAAKIKSQDGTRISASNGKVNFLLTKEQDHYFKHRVRKSLFKIKTETIQDEVETAAYNEIVGGVKVHATHGLTLELGQYEGESLTQTLDKFASNSELSWMGQIYNDPRFSNNLDIVYKELHELHIHKKTSNLSPAAMAIIAIAVSVAMGPAGAGWTGSGVNAIGPALNGMIPAAAMQAGAITLTTQAATGLASGKGIGGTLESMLQEDSIRSLATSMATAGVLNSGALKDLNFFNNAEAGSGFFASQQAIDIAQQATQAVIDSAVSAGISTIINGGDFGDFKGQFLGSLKSYAIAELGKQLASEIGDAVHSDPPKINQVTRYLAHAGVGCLTGTLTAAASNSDKGLGCSSGAGGAVVGELVADAHKEISSYSELEKELKNKDKKLQQLLGVEGVDDINSLTPAQMQTLEDNLMALGNLDYSKAKLMQLQSEGVDLAKLGAGLAAFIAGGEVNIAANAGANAAENNGFWFVLQGAYLLWKAYDAIEAARNVIAIGKRLNKVKNLPAGQRAAARNELIMELGFTLLGDVVLGQAPEVVLKKVKQLANKTTIGAELSLQLDQVIDSIERKVDFKVAGYAPANYNNPDQTAPGGYSDSGIRGHDTLKKSVIPRDKYTPAEWSLLKHNASAHTVERHGPHVTDEHLKHRASTGVAPDNSRIQRPPQLSSKFGSDEALKESLQKAAPTGELFKQALTLNKDAQSVIAISFDAGKSMGHGYKKVNGQMQKVSNLTKVVVRYKKDNNGVWYINTMYPSDKGVNPN
ncbi:DUF637 domain-containing protein [Pseudoalteromonas piscicida]|uniref:DUF637 domain-containing protein n=1 Tax=Pseudoalteromonas piscicida TaxID=43662 RepID=A0A2A5JK34_PSEO7|nr:DUF637 domain-containing protein [Pseudoalteromonas piscicida]PCK29571.1 hypothetical protein CEX98_22130 [Pseudoalteromonas piscicida]